MFVVSRGRKTKWKDGFGPKARFTRPKAGRQAGRQAGTQARTHGRAPMCFDNDHPWLL